MEALLSRVALAAQRLRAAARVRIVAHAGADGIAAAALLAPALEAHGIGTRVDIGGTDARAAGEEACFLDMGSAQPGPAVVCDHHETPSENPLLLHPRLLGLERDGACGAGLAYLLARELHPDAQRSAWLAVVGALGDRQDVEHRRLVGLNRDVALRDALQAGGVEARLDLRLPGREALPLPELLARAEDPRLPGLDDADAAARWLRGHGVELGPGHRQRRWRDLGSDEQRRVLSALAQHLLQQGRGPAAARRLVGEVYALPGQPAGTELRDARGFALALERLAAAGRTDLALALARGERGDALRAALHATRTSPRPARAPVVAGHLVQRFDAPGLRPPVAGMAARLRYAEDGVRRDLPLLAIARSGSSVLVSAQASSDVLRRGLRLGTAVADAARAVHGRAEGTDAAADATLPPGTEEAFLAELEARLARQAADAAGQIKKEG